MSRFRHSLILLGISAMAPPSFAQTPVPAQMAFFPGVVPVADNWIFEHMAWDDLDFPAINGDAHPIKRGEYWRLYVDLQDPPRWPQ